MFNRTCAMGLRRQEEKLAGMIINLRTANSIERPLAAYATKLSRGRFIQEEPSETRTPFQRDRDRIIHSGAFRKMRNKTQVFIEHEGDYYRTRLTHSLEVAQIARSISRALGLDEDLTEAIALAHDLGHTCFGHAGEDGLNEAMQAYGGFDHNEQAFRILTKIEQRYARFDGLNLTWETLEGIAKHHGPVAPEAVLPTIREVNAVWDLDLSNYAGPEAQVAALSDDIAYNTHDADDGHRAAFFGIEDLFCLPVIGASLKKMRNLYPNATRPRLMYEAVRDVIGLMIDDVLEQTRLNILELSPQSVEDIRRAKKPTVAFSEDMLRHVRVLHQYLQTHMYTHSSINPKRMKAKQMVHDLFDRYMDDPLNLPPAWNAQVKLCKDESTKARTIGDYVAGMTDRFAIKEHHRLFGGEMGI
ncbi:MAG: deoxyguanosinetriphosphate triphosphohydrolase [Alphaproteobacteria bacterium]|nr:deoxyguanosinetriphosphate triphosphohydrolase [Alphaproteobacteria bacterium]